MRGFSLCLMSGLNLRLTGGLNLCQVSNMPDSCTTRRCLAGDNWPAASMDQRASMFLLDNWPKGPATGPYIALPFAKLSVMCDTTRVVYDLDTRSYVAEMVKIGTSST